MTIVVEDGTGLVSADAYISVADADAYFTASANSIWTASTTPAKEVAIIKATRYIEKRFGTKWKGLISKSDQALGWPRRYVYDEIGTELADQVPVQVARACAEYAVQALINPLIPETVYPIADGAPVPFGRVNRKIEKVGPLYEETYYSVSGTNASKVGSGSALVDGDRVVQYPEADFLIGPFIKSTKGVSR